MAKFTVDSDEMANTVGTVQSQVESLRSLSSSITANLTRLEGSWQGLAQQQFQGVVDQWHGTQQQIEASIDSINRALAAAGQTYGDTESGVMRMFAA